MLANSRRARDLRSTRARALSTPALTALRSGGGDRLHPATLRAAPAGRQRNPRRESWSRRPACIENGVAPPSIAHRPRQRRIPFARQQVGHVQCIRAPTRRPRASATIGAKRYAVLRCRPATSSAMKSGRRSAGWAAMSSLAVESLEQVPGRAETKPLRIWLRLVPRFASTTQ
jgi:hypothetical protein